MYQKLVAYKKKHKSTIVPTEYQADPSLGIWVHSQRTNYIKKELHIDRINHLESIGFVWNAYDMNWREIYYRLVAYKMQHDSTAVPYRCTEDPSLGLWVSTQRVAYNNGKLSGKRLELLNSINFVWSAKKAS
ncbi:hypothetical protein FRACYDRAFT_224348 [Fragilariopsis cylindrus CCMP1102]|uniref:Helicase-associated domain-containing protein n=1 Tax=Fragilariopsis cylindrus CCMP1102 TaxID=635003 RepID=A0A1E7FTL6_9STRA|nr:hypothetical protein FRACYDRAFT_224348 [Fragilariopsis cylindrus CCMP1102]|eukprot:OEU21512.1 hypothetical protein FRACYDRAFT_224348 [Fragilariopsis cylindrus CCMP1102]